MWRHQTGGTGVFPTLDRSGNGKGRIGRAVAALICVALAAGCGSSSSSSAPPGSANSSSPAAAGSSTTAPPSVPSTSLSPTVTGTPACATSGPKVTLGVSQGYAGGVYETIVFTNTSGATCTLYGYYPPNQTVPVYLPDTSQICAQPVQTLFISAVQVGSGSS
jgi:hypothetical protein